MRGIEKTLKNPSQCQQSVNIHVFSLGLLEPGHPPYISRADSSDDRDRYQTVYARERGSVAAPTAGPANCSLTTT